MAKKAPPKKAHAQQRVREDVEVQAGLYELPIEIDAEGESAPEPATAEDGPPPTHLLVWMLDDGHLIGSELGGRAELMEKAGPTIRESFKELPFLPGTLKAESEDLVAALRPHISSRIQVVAGPTPELDEAAELVADQLLFPPTYFGEGVENASIASFFAATAKLYRARPWKVLDMEDWIGVDIPGLGIESYVLAVVGPSQEEPGWVLAPSTEDFELLQELDELAARREEQDDEDEDGEDEDGGEPDQEYPPVQFLSFQSRETAAPALLEEIDENGWETAGPKAVPYSATLQEDGELAEPGEDDFFQGEAISLALAHLLQDQKALRRALDGEGEPLVSRSVFEIDGESVEVVLTVPHPDLFEEEEPEPEPEPETRRRSGPAPAERNKAKTAGPVTGSSRRKR